MYTTEIDFSLMFREFRFRQSRAALAWQRPGLLDLVALPGMASTVAENHVSEQSSTVLPTGWSLNPLSLYMGQTLLMN